MAVTRAVFWYGCNMTRHGEIVRLVERLLAAVGIDAAPEGGPARCCGAPKESNARIVDGMARRTVDAFNAGAHAHVVTWCPSCHMNLTDTMAPVAPLAFEYAHVTQALHDRRDALAPLLTRPVRARVMLHAHLGFDGRVPVNTLVPALLRLIPEIDVVEHAYRSPGHMCSALAGVPGALTVAHRATVDAMAACGADTLCTIFHSCHRDAVTLERAAPIRVANWVHLLAESAGLPFTDDYKAWRNAADPRDAVGKARIAAMGELAFTRLVEPELRKPGPLAG